MARWNGAPPGGDVRDAEHGGLGLWGASPWAPALMGVHVWDPCGHHCCHSVLWGGGVRAFPSISLLPISQVKRPRAQLRLTEGPVQVAPRPGRPPSVAFSFPPHHHLPSHIFQIQSPVQGEREGRTAGLARAGKG